jgi:hypothetical protein
LYYKRYTGADIQYAISQLKHTKREQASTRDHMFT